MQDDLSSSSSVKPQNIAESIATSLEKYNSWSGQAINLSKSIHLTMEQVNNLDSLFELKKISLFVCFFFFFFFGPATNVSIILKH